jgi:excinuclease ABC subunit B
MRHSATQALFERRDVLVVASVSCIYGIGAPETYRGMHLALAEGARLDRDRMIQQLVAIQYERNDYDFHRGTFRVRGDVVEVFPASGDTTALRIELFGDTVEAVHRIDPLRGQLRERVGQVAIYPANHYVTPEDQLERAIEGIKEELAERLLFFRSTNRLLEAQRLEQRTLFDIEMLREIGYCHGIENYSRHLTGRKPGEPPPTLRRTRWSSSTRATWPSPRSGACTRGTGRARKRWSSTASGFPRPSTTARLPSRSSRR